MYKKSHQHVCADNYLLPSGTVGIKGRTKGCAIMKRSHFCLTIVLLLLLIMSACRNTPAKSGKIQCDSEAPTGSKSHDGNQTAKFGRFIYSGDY